MKNNQWIKSALLLCITSLAISSCNKDILNIKQIKLDEDLTSDWVIPLVKTKLNLKDIVPDSTGVLFTDNNGLYYIQYNSKIFEAKAKDYISIANQTFVTGSLPLSTPIAAASWSGTASTTTNKTFGFATSNGALLKTIKLKTGALSLTLNSSFKHNVDATITFPSVILSNSNPLVLHTTITYPATTASVNAVLDGSTIDLTNGNTTSNTLPYTVAFTVTGTGQPIAATDQINANVNMNNLQFSFIDGFLGTYNIPIPKDSILIDIFKNTSNTNIYLEDPKLNFTVLNYFGVAASGNFNILEGVSSAGTTTPITGSFFTSPFNVLGATTVGTAYNNFYTIDKSNSNLQTIINPAPAMVRYQGNLAINPAPINSGYNFVNDTSKIIVNGEVILPAWFKINSSTITDTFPITNLPKDTDIIQSVEMKMRVQNAIGITSTMQLYFEDANNNILDSLFNTGSTLVLPAATVDATTGLITAPATTDVITKLTRVQYQNIANHIAHGRLVATLKTSGSNSVKIRNVDYLNIQIAARSILKIKAKI